MSVLSSENDLERTTENKKWSFHSSLTEIRKCFVNGTQVGLVDEICPANIDGNLAKELSEVALRVHKILHLV